ncbi:hypothetical protein CO173_03455 [Candidatus Uhrbacteria bacterium CG_4_9_14_3_um_filter_41_35]|uniref:Type II secretion system protein GspG C-terminal domain-containing protein n=1 Tax=Candidatus Uhrbacteria bacterium CG_4_9_14_3_um_filter_41_35 TaxID=1975034 RepID=A0A2M7XE61_9BACT|nr:MAG: hypothetical protein COV92_01490 [Candidatus Uhrbacteria bacterium CG11_big_fil_rev_8_21_14_0_20_41_9]PJA46171.1 MAG: hypothetical protein CO173_03455 [Candidatus Uhrbacteria bacterium CG_4_9_14_3_um_filter_41_35]
MNNKGFTKVEILIVVAVIGVLGVVAGMAVKSARVQTRDAVRLSDVRQVQVGLELYFNDFSSYPQTTEIIPLGQASTVCLGSAGFAPSCAGASQTVYLDTIGGTPRTGLKGLASCGNIGDAYCYFGNANQFRIQFEIERKNSLLGLERGMNCMTESGLKAGACQQIPVPTPGVSLD